VAGRHLLAVSLSDVAPKGAATTSKQAVRPGTWFAAQAEVLPQPLNGGTPLQEDGMDISRRDFGRLLAGGGTAVGGLVGAGISLAPAAARAQQLRISNAKATPSICPFCAVGCATLIHTVEGRVVNIEGDVRSPHSEGTLCPKGAAIFQLHVNPNRPTQVLHRAPGAADWEVWDIERAMARVAELTKKTRDETFIEQLADGSRVNCTTSIFSLGGATLDNEWNHIQQKLMRGLGIVPIENQARI
jgi:formate dehydrogenase major subunit